MASSVLAICSAVLMDCESGNILSAVAFKKDLIK
jgi:hypothetical protein